MLYTLCLFNVTTSRLGWRLLVSDIYDETVIKMREDVCAACLP